MKLCKSVILLAVMSLLVGCGTVFSSNHQKVNKPAHIQINLPRQHSLVEVDDGPSLAEQQAEEERFELLKENIRMRKNNIIAKPEITDEGDQLGEAESE